MVGRLIFCGRQFQCVVILISVGTSTCTMNRSHILRIPTSNTSTTINLLIALFVMRAAFAAAFVIRGGKGGLTGTVCMPSLQSLRFRTVPQVTSTPYRFLHSSLVASLSTLSAKPKRAGSVVDKYQSVSVSCSTCRQKLFRYKKRNGTKSNLIKCFVERIVVDQSVDDGSKSDCFATKILQEVDSLDPSATAAATVSCPSCDTPFARHAMIRGLPALKLIGGKTRMTKK